MANWHQDFQMRCDRSQLLAKRHDAYMRNLESREAACARMMMSLDHVDPNGDGAALELKVEDIEPWAPEVIYYFGPHEFNHVGNIFTLVNHTALADLPPMEKRCSICLGSKEEGPLPTVSLPCGHTFHQDCIARDMLRGEKLCALCTVKKREYLFIAEPSWDEFYCQKPVRFYEEFLKEQYKPPPSSPRTTLADDVTPPLSPKDL
ncbi:hypothetical protein IFR05_016631 [Cadophora sp. M221]|nr:hypothetical protein IFR05_016631 [Cadophora sp. M221]